MNFGSFIKPTVWKIILTVLLFIITYLFFRGIPFTALVLMFGGPNKINYINFIVDIVFWYLVSAIIISIFTSKSRNK